MPGEGSSIEEVDVTGVGIVYSLGIALQLHLPRLAPRHPLGADTSSV
jgi:hypothetical protein